MSPVRFLIAAFALLLLLAPVRGSAQTYECGPSTIGSNCRTLINDGWNTRDGVISSSSITSALTVLPGACSQLARIADVDLEIQVAHPYVGDLEVLLAHPDGTTVALLYRPGVTVIDHFCPNDDLDIRFDDDDGMEVRTTCNGKIPALGGAVLPFNALTSFDGKPRNGQWTLTIRDHVPGGEGVLLGWTLELPCTADLPDVSVDTTDATVAERGSDDKAVVTFTRGGGTSNPLEVEYVVTGSASLADFTSPPGKITIPSGSASATLEVRAVADEIREIDETIIITLLQSPDYEIGGRGSAYITLTEQDGVAAGSGGSGATGGVGGRGGTGGTGGRAGAAGEAGGAGDGEGDAGPDAGDEGSDDDGCDCRVAGGGSREPPVIPLVFAALLGVVALRRLRRR